MKGELSQYSTNFYVHSGGGVKWGAGKDLANNLDPAFKDQPSLKDGRKIIDCEGYAAMTEKMLGGIQDPATKKPMFELEHVKSPDHTMVGVFRAGDPSHSGFTVNNNEVKNVTPAQLEQAKSDLKAFKAAPTPANIEQQLMKNALRESLSPDQRGTSISAGRTYAATEEDYQAKHRPSAPAPD